MKSDELPVANFRDQVYDLMARLPKDKVTTYGDLALWAGHPYAARTVGEIAHGGPDSLHWYRLVNSKGGLATGFHGGQEAQRQLLMQDGIMRYDEFRVIGFEERRWKR